MPTYLYKNIETGEIYELVQSMRDDAYRTHPVSGVPVKRILARPGIAFKGSGFYANDSRKGSSESGSSSGTSSSTSSGSSSGDSSSSGSKGGE
ncbi:FmdB family transcriptional regulator [Deinococcus sp. KSM4-11]|uniref:FmdB family zinc ribbon protein n=1 Tax=Deinococcus sp. KSM4-11 TaxID=2568654 RepID=UPI0010A48EAA|nr:FmdB family transcriptional regulator [Deinococcus sp. KSM4-11]